MTIEQEAEVEFVKALANQWPSAHPDSPWAAGVRPVYVSGYAAATRVEGLRAAAILAELNKQHNELLTELEKAVTDESTCWHCKVCLQPVPLPACDSCPTECDDENCTAEGCLEQRAEKPNRVPRAPFRAERLQEACTEAAGSVLLDVQQDAIAKGKRIAELEKEIDNLDEELQQIDDAVVAAGGKREQGGASFIAELLARKAGTPPRPRPLDDWHDDIGTVQWWRFPVEEPPYVGSPLDDDWPGYHTHWTPLTVPDALADISGSVGRAIKRAARRLLRIPSEDPKR